MLMVHMAILMKGLLGTSAVEIGQWASMSRLSASLAQTIVKTDYHTLPKTDATINDIKKALQQGKPVWASVTLDFQVPTDTDFVTWQTSNGQVKVTPLNHACVVTGYDNDNIYVNDPYGEKIDP